MPSTRRLRAVIGTALASTLVLGVAAGCGTKVSGDHDAAADKTLTYWSSWKEGEPQQVLFQTIIDDFQKSTGIKVEARWLGRDYVTVINNQNAVGKGPDFYDDATDHIADFRAKGGIGTQDGVLAATIPGENVSVQSVLSKAVVSGSSDDKGLGLIPYSTITTAMWFDAAAHPEWKSSPPKTFDDFLAEAQEIKSGGTAPIALDGQVNFYNAYWFYWLMMRHGGPGSLAALAASPSNWDKPEVLAAAQDAERLAKAGLFEPDFLATKYPAAQNQWAQGHEAFELNGSWLASEVKPNQKSGFSPQTFQFPSVPGGHDSVEAGTLGWTINAKAANASGAEKFIAFALQKKYMEQISTKALNIPARSDIPAPDFLVSAQQAILSAHEVNKTYDGAPAAYPDWWNNTFLPLDDKLLSGAISAAQFVAQGKAATASGASSK